MLNKTIVLGLALLALLGATTPGHASLDNAVSGLRPAFSTNGNWLTNVVVARGAAFGAVPAVLEASVELAPMPRTLAPAPVSGGEVGARAASLTIMCGGDPAVFGKVHPLLEKMGKNITLVGGNGDGQTAKVANQIIVALNIAAVGEALLFASKAGADPARVREALMGGFAASRILEVHR